MNIDIELFEKNLLATRQYCHLQAKHTQESIAHALRTIDRYNEIELFLYKEYSGFESFESFVSANWKSDPDKGELYDKLFDMQLSYKYDFLADKTIANFDIEGGRVLIAEIDKTVIDGASEAASQGLIDGYDCPPIDTWFYMVRVKGLRVLFAWIPEHFVGLVDEAIAINCINCLFWNDKITL